jgi:hypothetical protein
VFNGRVRVYYNWPNYQEQVHRFYGACFKNSYEEGIAAFKSITNSILALAMMMASIFKTQ